MSTASASEQSGQTDKNSSVQTTTTVKQLTGDRFENWVEFTKHLSDLQKLNPLAQFCQQPVSSQSSLGWGLPADLRDVLPGRLSSIDALPLPPATDGSDAASQKEFAAMQAIVLANQLSRLAEATDETAWCGALKSLLTKLNDLHQSVSDQASKDHTSDEENDDSALLRQWLAIELPMTLAYWFPEIPECAALAESALDVLIVEQEEMLDADGTLNGPFIHQLPAFFATWTRSISLAKSLELKLDGQSQEKWEWFIRFAMRMLRKNGTVLLSDKSIIAAPEMFAAALETSTDKEDRSIAGLVIPSATSNPVSKKNKKSRKKRQVLVDHGTYSEWAGVAILQTDWSPKSPRVAIAFDDDNFEMEICRGRSLLQLKGTPQISLNGKTLHRTGEWEEVCWYSDDDVDYLEVEVEFESGVRLQRQVCLLRAEDALFVADAVLNNSAERIDYQVSLDLADSISTMRETENNEIYLRDKKDKIRSLVLPLCVSEWQKSRTDDSIDDNDGRITLKQASLSKNLYAAWLIDLCPKRSVKPRTWRSLTVGEGLEIVSPEVARAFRIRIGQQQWLVYRSMGEVGNRTFLGQNRNCEFFIGRFKEDGNVDELISIE